MNARTARWVILFLAGCDTKWLSPDGHGHDQLQLDCAPGRACNPIPVNGFPAVLTGDTRTSGDDLVDAYACSSSNEGGREVWYAVDVPSAGRLTASIVEVSGDGIDVDVHLLSTQAASSCLARGDAAAVAQVDTGRTWVVVDTYVKSGAPQAGPYTLTIDFVPLPVSSCATVPTDVTMRWSSCSSSVPDCSKSGSTVLLSTPTTGPVVKEAHLVTIEDGISGWPSSSRDRITAHYATSASVSGYDMDRTESWAPAGEGGSKYGQGATGVKIPAEAEAFYLNMNWKTLPAAGTAMIVRNPANGRAVVAAAGYETGPSPNTSVAGVSEEVHDWLGTDHLDDLEIGFAADPHLPYGPVVCQDGEEPPPPPPPPPEELEACYLGSARNNAVCLAVDPLPSSASGYTYPAPQGSQDLVPVHYLDLTTIDPSLHLAPSFLLSELAQESKGDLAVLSPSAIEHLQAMRDDLGAIVVVLGYVSPGYNQSIGGGARSRHLYGDGFDLDPVSVSVSALADACESEGASYVVAYTSHVHCDWADESLEAAFFGGTRSARTEAPVALLSADLVPDGAGWTAPAEGFDEGEPLRTWTAYGADGVLLETATQERYTPPEDAVRIEVDLGRQLRLDAAL